MITETVETRWFLPGDLPESVLEWLRAACDGVEAEDERTDIYLRLPQVESAGLKFRADRLEVKRRTGTVRPAADATKEFGCWRKFALGTSDFAAEGRERDWMRVRKKRWLRAWARTGGKVEPVGADGGRRPLCMVELARVRLDEGPPWWTLCFEATGEARPAADLIYEVGRRLLFRPDAPALKHAVKEAYPAWLDGRARDADTPVPS